MIQNLDKYTQKFLVDAIKTEPGKGNDYRVDATKTEPGKGNPYEKILAQVHAKNSLFTAETDAALSIKNILQDTDDLDQAITDFIFSTKPLHDNVSGLHSASPFSVQDIGSLVFASIPEKDTTIFFDGNTIL